MAKRRKVNRNRLILVIAAFCCIIVLLGAGVWWGVNAWNHHQEQSRRQQLAADVSKSIENQQTVVDSVQKPEEMDDEAFQALKQQASACIDGSILELVSAEGEISDELNDKLESYQMQPSCEQAQYLLSHISEYSADILEYYLKDPDRYEFVKAYPQREELQSAPDTLSESLDSVPALLQWDTRWGYEPYGDSTVYYAGCAPTSLAMVFSYLKQDPSITPAKIKEFSENNGYYVDGVGTSHALLSDAAVQYGVNVEGVAIDEASVREALSQGKVLIFNMVPGTFTQVGHFLVVSAEHDGKLVIRDPNSISRTNKEWEYSEVLPETAAIWAYSV